VRSVWFGIGFQGSSRPLLAKLVECRLQSPIPDMAAGTVASEFLEVDEITDAIASEGLASATPLCYLRGHRHKKWHQRRQVSQYYHLGKANDKVYYRHSGFPGGIYATKFKDMQAKHPGRAIEKAVKGMLPKGPLGYAMIKKLKVYAGGEHPHTAQQPKALEI
jgi:hypothetical protein